MWCECDSRTLDEELCSPAPHRTESQTTCGHCLHPAFPGETRAHMEWVGASLAVSCGMEQGPPTWLRTAWKTGSGWCPPDCTPSADNKDILLMLSDMDINAIAGTLKLYFRELPEPLLTDRLYPAFMEGIGEALWDQRAGLTSVALRG